MQKIDLTRDIANAIALAHSNNVQTSSAVRENIVEEILRDPSTINNLKNIGSNTFDPEYGKYYYKKTVMLDNIRSVQRFDTDQTFWEWHERDGYVVEPETLDENGSLSNLISVSIKNSFIISLPSMPSILSVGIDDIRFGFENKNTKTSQFFCTIVEENGRYRTEDIKPNKFSLNTAFNLSKSLRLFFGSPETIYKLPRLWFTGLITGTNYYSIDHGLTVGNTYRVSFKGFEVTAFIVDNDNMTLSQPIPVNFGSVMFNEENRTHIILEFEYLKS